MRRMARLSQVIAADLVRVGTWFRGFAVQVEADP